MLVTHGHSFVAPAPPASIAVGSALGPCTVTIGNFDGVHRGHGAMLARLKDKAVELGLPSCVLTFEPHPREFFAPQAAPARLTRLAAKLEILRAAGIDRVHVARFDARFSAQSPEQFIEAVLLEGLACRWLLVGRDFRFGARRAGDFALLEQVSRRRGFGLEAMPEVKNEGERISSSAVRAALEQGDLEQAAALLGRPYAISGRVAHGDRLGRALGFPTANIRLPHRPPLAGIFVVEVEGLPATAGQGAAPHVWSAVASIGVRPTIKETAVPLLEVHLFDFAAEIYGRRLNVRFLHKLRDEEKYPDLETLRDAIARDAANARDFFALKTP